MTGFFSGKKIIIVGGTGTIGQSLLNSILADHPQVVRVFSRDEYKQFLLQQEYKEFTNIRYLIGDVRDYNRLERAMQDIDFVFHTAAMKHVPACEYNPFEAVQTNIIGTQNVIQAALACEVERVVFTSTDKAISPTNTYGASKLMAERLITAAQYHAGSKKTVFAAVRFGNVMGSRGSVIPLFKQQIKTSRKITVTCRDMTRFMMTLRQATELTMKAMQIAQGGETFVLKMPVVKLIDLAEVIIRNYSTTLGIDPDSIKIEEIGFRPGEKMYEELMTEEESTGALETSDMFIIRNSFLTPQNYSGASPSTKKSYSSHGLQPISANELNELLRDHNLLD
ncbi:polysaccharide biosynthesis protein [Paenibacillus sp. alder61]|uniref:Polysaccharide biosynthesis protein n=1 Tax=Paenibacillus faecis TaxID=862114 RepID=A0A5D0CPJ0_9BACL|nr:MULTISPECIES: UDP-N-acetylglucosamine 4,6-dehydratase family protein [Paenibacillus]MCA1293984.1 polysaccharide biosynthesis protein [Paenibacillus sp. alder61]TYA11866.1 polysaccharide biosynthesis protein [Paenibacillus faecis]